MAGKHETPTKEAAPCGRCDELAIWQQAFGLLTTLAPDLEINVRDAMGMAIEIERHVLAERTRLEAAERDAAELRADNEMNAHYAKRALVAEAKLALVDKYGEEQWNSGWRWDVTRADSEKPLSFNAWLAQNEMQPCPKCGGTGHRYNRYGEMGECMDCDARGVVQS